MPPKKPIDGKPLNGTDWRDTTLSDVRRIFHEADPEMVEEQKWMGSPAWSHNGLVCVATKCKDKVKLTFSQGAHLADADYLFNNGFEGKQWRAIDIHQDDKIKEASLKKLISAAVDRNTAKLKTTGKSVGRLLSVMICNMVVLSSDTVFISSSTCC